MSHFFFNWKEYKQILREIFLPDEIYEKVTDIDLDKLYSKGFRSIFLDIDNTIVPYSQRKASLEYLNWIEKVHALGFQLYYVSNNSSYKRILTICHQTKTKGTYLSLKPLIFNVQDLMLKTGTSIKESVVIGDQISTDIVMGKWLKSFSILVDPMDKKMKFWKTVQRQMELFVFEKLQA